MLSVECDSATLRGLGLHCAFSAARNYIAAGAQTPRRFQLQIERRQNIISRRQVLVTTNLDMLG